MAKPIEFFFDYVSPYSFVAWHMLPGLREETGAEIVCRPMFLGGVMEATGNRPPGMVPAKGRYMAADLARHVKRLGVAFAMTPYFPMNTLRVLRATLGLEGEPETQARFMAACFKHAWSPDAPKNLGERGDVEAMCAEEGFDAERIHSFAADPAMKAKLTENTEEAVERGAFGAPSFFVGDELYFGTDRLDWVAEAARAA